MPVDHLNPAALHRRVTALEKKAGIKTPEELDAEQAAKDAKDAKDEAALAAAEAKRPPVVPRALTVDEELAIAHLAPSDREATRVHLTRDKQTATHPLIDVKPPASQSPPAK